MSHMMVTAGMRILVGQLVYLAPNGLAYPSGVPWRRVDRARWRRTRTALNHLARRARRRAKRNAAWIRRAAGRMAEALGIDLSRTQLRRIAGYRYAPGTEIDW